MGSSHRCSESVRAPRVAIVVASKQRFIRLPGNVIRRHLQRVVEAERAASAELSIALVDDAQIHIINRDYLQHDWPTDVVTFSFEDSSAAPTRDQRGGRTSGPATSPLRAADQRRRRYASAPPRGEGRIIDGEIVASAETALREAGRRGHSPENELLLYLIHGVLHLCGYDDKTPAEKRRMRARERDMLELCGLPAPGRSGRRSAGDRDR